VIDATGHYNLYTEAYGMDVLRSRCLDLIDVSKNLREENACRMLFQGCGAVYKTQEFEDAWRIRRLEWLEKVHGGDANGVVEWVDNGPPSSIQARTPIIFITVMLAQPISSKAR
jgi:hypothetical protein